MVDFIGLSFVVYGFDIKSKWQILGSKGYRYAPVNNPIKLLQKDLP